MARKWFTSRTRTTAPTPPHPKLVRWNKFRPELETLENRLVPATESFFTNPNLAIPDFVSTPGVATSNLVVGSSAIASIADINVHIRINHTWQGDLSITLTNGAKTAILVDRIGHTGTGFGSSNDNLGTGASPGPYVYLVLDDEAAVDVHTIAVSNPTGSFKPDANVNGVFPGASPLSLLDGLAGNGTWTLKVQDNAGGDVGTLINWGITIDDGKAANTAPTVTAANPTVNVNEGSLATNNGTFNDVDTGDIVTISASVGSVSFTPSAKSGTWNWSLGTTDGPNQSQVVTITATDKAGAMGTTTFNLGVANVAPTISTTGASNVDEGTSYTLNLGSVVDPGADTVTQYRVRWGDGNDTGFIVGNPNLAVLNHSYADGPNSYTINVDLIDEDGTHLAAGSRSVTVDNVDPTATFSNNGPVDEGSMGTVSFSAQNDVAADVSAGFKYAYDVDNNGLYDDGFGDGTYAGSLASAMFNLAAAMTADGPASVTIGGRIIDKDEGFTDYDTTVMVKNVLPTQGSVTVTGAVMTGANAYDVPACSPVTFSVTATDPGLPDLLTFEFDFDGNGTFEHSSGPIAENDGTWSYTAPPVEFDVDTVVHIRVRDDDDGTFVNFPDQIITAKAILLVDGNLVVSGSNSADSISINTATPGSVSVMRNGKSSVHALPMGGRIIARGCDGNDVITVNGPVSAEVYGGNGNDYLYGGSGADQLWGEDGNDYLSLGAGDDVGIGGLGRDLLYGGNGNDILLGGALDPMAFDWATLQTATAAWNAWTTPPNPVGSVPPEVVALMVATNDPNDTANYDRFWGNAGKDAFVYRTSGTLDQLNDYKTTDKDGLAGF